MIEWWELLKRYQIYEEHRITRRACKLAVKGILVFLASLIVCSFVFGGIKQ